MNFEELGLTLKREREKRGLSVEVVMEATKISRTNITAMENGDRSSMPHPVYAKGFVKSYARYLGLDADELSMVIDREFQDENSLPDDLSYDVSPAAEKAFHDGETPENNKKTNWPIILGIVIVIGISIFLAMTFLDKGNEVVPDEVPAVSKEETPPPPPIVEQESEQYAPTQSEESDEESQNKAEEQGGQNENVESPAVEEPPVEAPETTEAAQAAPESESISSTASPQSDPMYEHVLIIRATTEKGCWIGVWKGDESDMSRDFVLKKGEPLRLMFNSPRRIRIGNVAGVTVMYNGEPYQLDGSRGNIQTLRLGF